MINRGDNEHDPEQHLASSDVGLSLERLDLAIGKLPGLRVVRLDSILLHEEPDTRRYLPLKDRIASVGTLRNPLIAARDHGAASHILLDGVNRLEALRALGAVFVLIQEVDLDDMHLILSTWHHAFEGLEGEALISRLSLAVEVVETPGAFTEHGDFIPPVDKDQACSIVLPNRSCHGVKVNGTPENRLDILAEVVRLLEEATNLDRVSYTNMDDLHAHYADFAGLVCYSGFTKDDVLRLSIKGRRFPSGITRFSIPKRALGFAIPLEFLKEEGSLEAKEAGLRRMIVEKVRQKSIRFYEEPTFYFDD
jgi:hypothetical protein